MTFPWPDLTTSETSSYLVPTLTTVCTNAEEIGRRALCLLLERMQKPDQACQQVYVPARLAVRGSTGPVSGLLSSADLHIQAAA